MAGIFPLFPFRSSFLQCSKKDLFVGATRQEKWIYRNWKKLHVPVAMGVGGALKIVVGVKKRDPRWMQNAGLEWLYCPLQDPRRKWGRYVSDAIVFPILLIFSWLKLFVRHLYRPDIDS